MSAITFYSLSDYNNGSLIPFTIDLSEVNDKEEYYTAMNEALKDITEDLNDGDIREEWIVADFEDVPSTLVGEYDLDDTYWDYKELLDDEDVDMVQAAMELGIQPDNILDNYVGEYPNNEELFDNLGGDIIQEIEDTVPSWVCIDWKQTADNFAEDYYSENGYYFYSH
ncbi:MAG: hypothetical protein HOK52_14755 [Candidatus Marinimicrobia bacterium]|jgi:antirestriction protein|nr:hypothetical protein [Candidatus Neomarinimicrobiota bacterium]